MTTIRTISLLVAGATLVGCAYEEDALEHFDITGKVRIPKEAAEIYITVTDDDGNAVDKALEADVRNLGPVYLGVFPAVDESLFDYPHPEIGPVLSSNTLDVYPYGGTTVGRPDFACYQALRCKVTTGRFESYDDILDYFATELETPIENQYGEEVTTAAEFREWCFETMFLTSDDELPFLGEVDFEDKGDYYEADATIYHSYFKEDAVVWGWMDSPSRSFNFASCNTDAWGWQMNYYDQEYQTGGTEAGLLNTPDNFIDLGDWIAGEAPSLKSPEDNFVVELGFHYE